tara:strand:+ start:421 stop:747 length:327 start_codon:yes stop_codon:yes gene_type:complete
MANLRQGIQTLSATVKLTSSGEVVAAVSGQYIYITDLIISAGTAGTVKVVSKTGTPTTLVEELNLAANGNLVSNYVTPLKGLKGENIGVVIGTSNPVTVQISYYLAAH